MGTCSYLYSPEKRGIDNIMELATYAVICRKCESEDCVQACTKDALEKQEDGVLKRYNMRCISCKSCSAACPFGTILPESLPYIMSHCDYCLGRLKKGEKPECVRTTKKGLIKYGEFNEDDQQNIVKINENMLVKCAPWKKAVKKEKKK